MLSASPVVRGSLTLATVTTIVIVVGDLLFTKTSGLSVAVFGAVMFVVIFGVSVRLGRRSKT